KLGKIVGQKLGNFKWPVTGWRLKPRWISMPLPKRGSPWHNDTIGAIVGAAVGALHGRSALPKACITGLLGRTRGTRRRRVRAG
ncbi:MAG TPA: ADP-ribosylglycohydrolase family protein, partial [Acidobacteriota bacterium]|nr:ADP-ribosylglycohydrolase family protein [Acidobacteriota bacterium]